MVIRENTRTIRTLAVVGEEEERAILFDGPADAPAELIDLQFGTNVRARLTRRREGRFNVRGVGVQ